MKGMKKISLLVAALGLAGAAAGHTVGSLCYQVNNTRCSVNGSTRTCYLVAGSKPLNCYCFNGTWDCPVEP